MDLVKVQKNSTIQIKTNDLNSVKFSFYITDNNVVCNLSGALVRLTIRKPSGLTVMQECAITEPLGGECEIYLSNQAFIEQGSHIGEIVISKGDSAVVTQQFDYQVLEAIMNDETLESSNDWQALHELMINNDLRPILGDGSPNGVTVPEYQGQTYLDRLGMVMYFASTLSNDSWLAFGTGGVGGGTSGPIYWDDVLLKPETFTPSTHNHEWNEITGKPSQFSPVAHSHDWSTGITNKPTSFTPSAHSHTEADVTFGGLNARQYVDNADNFIINDMLNGLKFWTGTQAAYDQLAKDASTLYFITG